MWTELVLPAIAAAIGYWLRTKGPLLGGSPTPPAPPPTPSTPPAPPAPVAPPLLPGLPTELSGLLPLLLEILAKRRQREAHSLLSDLAREVEPPKK